MPQLDATGPRGAGPGTGRRRGSCCGIGYIEPIRGFGRGLGRYFAPKDPVSQTDRLDQLGNYLTALEEEISDVRSEIEQLKKVA